MSLKKPLYKIEAYRVPPGFSHEHLKMTTIHFSAMPWLNSLPYHMQEAILSPIAQDFLW
jgi:hypothetical protein